ncbi:MAG: peptidylprolyl isomerase [Smithellaceae bacterium]|nr:peptidylprolyl isomerase [Smithellaceae bacterium]
MKTIVKRISFITLLCLLLGVPARAGDTDRIVAFVNDDIITLSELNNLFTPFQERIDGYYKGADKAKVTADAKADLLNKLIDKMLVEQEAKKEGIAVSDTEVMDTVRGMLTQRNMTMEQLTQELAKEGSDLDSYRRDIREQLTRMRLIRKDIRPKATVSDEEIGAYYSTHLKEYEGKEAVRIKQILLVVDKKMDAAAKAQQRARADEVLKRLQVGESFEALAAQYSQGAEAASGGDIGFIEKGLMYPEVEKVAFALETDKISGIIESPAGLHIIKVVDRRGAGTKPLEAVREEITEKLMEGKMSHEFEKWLQELRDKSHIKVQL